MNGGVRILRHEVESASRLPWWPFFVCHLPLEEFSIQLMLSTPMARTNKVYKVSTKHIEMLNPDIRRLFFASCFHVGPMPLFSIFPHLTHLHTFYYPGSDVVVEYPSTGLRELRVWANYDAEYDAEYDTFADTSPPFFEGLSDVVDLELYQVPSFLKSKPLPKGLQSLRYHPFLFNLSFPWPQLPSHLTLLDIGYTCNIALMNADNTASMFPQSLTDLRLSLSSFSTWSQLPCCLKRLSFRLFGWNMPMISSEDVARLPRTLESFIGEHYIPADISDHTEIPLLFPPLLQTYRGLNTLLSIQQWDSLPKSLTTYEGCVPPNARSWPPNLTSLNIRSDPSHGAALSSLPMTLTDLSSLRMSEYVDLPRILTRLDLIEPKPEVLNEIVLPPNLRTFSLQCVHTQTSHPWIEKLPKTITEMTLVARLSSELDKLPSSITCLSISNLQKPGSSSVPSVHQQPQRQQNGEYAEVPQEFGHSTLNKLPHSLRYLHVDTRSALRFDLVDSLPLHLISLTISANPLLTFYPYWIAKLCPRLGYCSVGGLEHPNPDELIQAAQSLGYDLDVST